MSPILEQVQKFLTAHELTAHPHGDGEALVVPMSLTHCRCSIAFHHEPGSELLTILGLHPETVPPARRAAVAEFLTRLNWSLNGQRFLMDWEDGEVRVRTDLLLLAMPSLEQISRCFLAACATIDGFHPAVMNVIYRGMPPVQAVEQGEADLQKLLAKSRRESSD